MKNGNKILLGILVFVVVCVVGYALFSETITVTGTATASGKVDLTVTSLTDSEIEKEGLGDTFRGIVTSSNISIVDNAVTTNITFGMPGSTRNFVIKVENTGTVPVYLKSITDENGNPYEYGASGLFAGKIVKNQDKTSTIVVDIFPDLDYLDDYEIEVPLGPDSAASIEDVSLAILDPGESTYYYMEYSWLVSSTSQEEMSLSWTINFNWEQITVN